MFRLLWKSLYSAEDYAAAIEGWRWKTAIYFLFLCAISTALSSAFMLPAFLSFAASQKDYVASQIPDAEISGGTLKMKSDKPVFIKFKDGENFMAMTPSFLEPAQTRGLMFAMEKDRLAIIMGDAEQYVFYRDLASRYMAYRGLPESGAADAPIKINPESARSFIEREIMAAAYTMLPAICFGVSFFFDALLVLIALFSARIMGATLLPGLGLFGAFKIALIASTPAAMMFALEFTFFGVSQLGIIIYPFLTLAIMMKIMRRLAASGWRPPNAPL